MDIQEKRAELIRYFKDKLREQTLAVKEMDESQRDLLELQMQKTTFSLILLEEGQTVFNDEKVELTDTRIEMMYRNYFENPS